MSFCARVKFEAFQSYQRVFDFGQGKENDNIYLCNNRDSQDLKFSIRRGSNGHDVKVRSFFQLDEWGWVAVESKAPLTMNSVAHR
jgi:hypothetical protein